MMESNSVDTYILALLASSLYNLERKEEAKKYADEIASH